MPNLRKHYICVILSLLICWQVFLVAGQMVWADPVSVSGSFNYDAARQMLDLVNQTRAAAGLGPLVYDYNLEDYAKQRAAELTVLNSHVRPDGSNVAYSENYSIGWATAGDAQNAFVNSSSHYANIVGGYTTMAGACFVSGGQTYWVQIYSNNASGGAPNGWAGVQAETRTVNAQGAAAAAPQYADLDDALTLKVGAYIKVNAGINGQMTNGTWSSDQPGVATVDSSGTITGVSPGVCLVTGNFGVTAVRIQVTVMTTGTPPVQPAPAPPEAAPQPAPSSQAPAGDPESAGASEDPADPAAPAEEPESLATQDTSAEAEPFPPARKPEESQPSQATKAQATSRSSRSQRTEATRSHKPTEPRLSEAVTSLAQKSFLAADGMSEGTRGLLIVVSLVGIVVASSLIVLVAKSGR